MAAIVPCQGFSIGLKLLGDGLQYSRIIFLVAVGCGGMWFMAFSKYALPSVMAAAWWQFGVDGVDRSAQASAPQPVIP